MKVALITDTHFGIRNDNKDVLNHQNIFFDNIFFPYLEKNKIDTIIHLGDLVDRRKYINFHTLDNIKNNFFSKIKNRYKFYIIAGNHDVYYKDTNELNALKQILPSEFEFYTEPTELVLEDSTQIALLPWICRENQEASFKLIEQSKSLICFGHLQLLGFEMHRGSFATDGLPKEMFNKFDIVCSGHFHHKSTYGNINYLGCPYQMNWGDYSDTKGFHIFDTKTRDLTFIPNTYKLFHKIEYNDKNSSLEEIIDQNFKDYSRSYLRVVIKEKNNPFWLDTFIEKLEDIDPIAIQIIEDLGNVAYEGESTDLLHVEDTITLLSKYCDDLGVNERLKPELNELLQSLYTEANNERIA